MSHHAPPPGGRELYCPCGCCWTAVYGSRSVRDDATALLARLGLDQVPCLACGGRIGAVPASAEGRR